MAVIALMACADTKYHEIAYVSGLIREKGYTPLTIDISTGPQVPIRPDITRDEVLSAGGCTWEQVYALGKSEAVSRMAECAARKVYELYTKKAFDGILGMGGLQNTTVCSAALRTLPIGFPKMICSTVASGGREFDIACLLKNELLEDEEERGYVWHNEILTHTRLYESEILDITRTIAARLNRSRGKTKVILPMGGLRTMSYEGEIFYKPETIQKMKKIFEQELRPEIGFQAYDMNFCDPEFADVCAAEMMKLLGGDWQA